MSPDSLSSCSALLLLAPVALLGSLSAARPSGMAQPTHYAPFTNGLIGPLATTFTPPASCTDLSIQIYSVLPVPPTTEVGTFRTVFVNKPLFYENGELSTNPACFPSGFDELSDYGQYYSPGVCPSSWTLVSGSVLENFVSSITPPTSQGQSVGLCCPPRFTYVSGSDCQSTVASPTAAAAYCYGECEYACLGGGPACSATYSSNSVIQSGDVAFASYIQIRWSNDTSVLSPSAKAGIGIGVPVAVFILAALSTWIIFRKLPKRRQAHSSGTTTSPVGPLLAQNELQGMQVHGTQNPEGGTQNVNRMPHGDIQSSSVGLSNIAGATT